MNDAESGVKYLNLMLPNGENLAFRVRGQGPEVLVLVHGNVSTSFFWERFMTRLPARYRAIAVDLRGAGCSSYCRPVEHMVQFAQDIVYLIEALDIRRCHLAGLSMGGLVCQQLAVDHPSLAASLSLIGSPSCQGFPLAARDHEGQPIPGQFQTSWTEILNDPAQVVPMREIMAGGDPEVMKKVYDKSVFNSRRPEEAYYTRLMAESLTCRNYPDCLWPMHTFNISTRHNGVRPGSGRCRDLNMPALVISGADDILVPPALARQLAEELGPRTELNFISGAGHIPFIDDENAVLDLLLAFWERHPAAG